MEFYKKISSELKLYFESNSILRILLPIDVLFMYIGLFIIVLQMLSFQKVFVLNYFFISISIYCFFFGASLCFANMNNKNLCLGFCLFSLIQFTKLLISIFTNLYYKDWFFIDFDSLIPAFLFGYFSFQIYKTFIHTPHINHKKILP
jgi:hypothetical protein